MSLFLFQPKAQEVLGNEQLLRIRLACLDQDCGEDTEGSYGILLWCSRTWLGNAKGSAGPEGELKFVGGWMDGLGRSAFKSPLYHLPAGSPLTSG